MNFSRKYTLFGVLLALLFCGCEGGFLGIGAYTVKPDQYGIRFRNLPRILGGGISSSVLKPGEMAFIWPWETVITYTTGVREVSWGPQGRNKEYVYTRAKDGNEVALEVTLLYQVKTESSDLVNLANNVGIDDASVEELVVAVARSDIRHYMNELRTAEFIDPQANTQAVDRVRQEMQNRLKKYSIEVIRVNLVQYRFERALPDGTKDDTYQEKRDEIQTITQETSREVSRLDTIVADKEAKFNQVQGEVNRLLAEATGQKQQSIIRGDNYLKAKLNDAKAILELGRASVEGTIAQINAVSGIGGKALLKLDIANALQKNDSKFILMNEGSSSNGINLSKTDVNELLKVIGVAEAVKGKDEAQSEVTTEGAKVGTITRQEVKDSTIKN
jgi:hypothetical protein